MPAELSLTNDLTQVLPGRKLNDRWVVGAVKSKSSTITTTGGNFSVVFECADSETGNQVFLKVVDVNKAINSYSHMPLADLMIKIGEEHRFEGELMDHCTAAGLNRVVVCLDHGDAILGTLRVLFLVFEIADKGDTHKIKEDFPDLLKPHIGDKWWLETLHNVATGLNQLHNESIVHQDVKPSNVLFFEKYGAKIGDLGRAVKRGEPSRNMDKNGDRTHSPPEVWYSMRSSEWGIRYLSVDLYMLGNLLHYHFSGGCTATLELMNRLDPTFNPYHGYRGSFRDATPALEEAFGRMILTFRSEFVNHLPTRAADMLTAMFTQLCQPDPSKRGHPRDHALKHGVKFSVQRYISQIKSCHRLIS